MESIDSENVNTGVVKTEDHKRYKSNLSWSTFICRVTNPRVTCRQPADPSS